MALLLSTFRVIQIFPDLLGQIKAWPATELGDRLPSTLQRRRRSHLPHPSEGQHGLGQWFYRARKSSCLGKSFKQEAHSCYPGRSVGCGLKFIAGHHRTTDPVDVKAGCPGEAGGQPADRCSSFSAPWEGEVINAHFVPLAGGSPYTSSFLLLACFLLGGCSP